MKNTQKEHTVLLYKGNAETVRDHFMDLSKQYKTIGEYLEAKDKASIVAAYHEEEARMGLI